MAALRPVVVEPCLWLTGLKFRPSKPRAAAGAGTAIGGNYGIATSLVEAILVE